MTFWPTDPSIFTIIRDVVIAAAALSTAVVAIRGLRTWRSKLRGGTQYETARGLLQQAIAIRDAITRVRDSFAKPDFRPIEEVFPDFLAGVREAEATLGPQVREAIKPLEACVTKLWVRMQYLEQCGTEDGSPDRTAPGYDKAHATVYPADNPNDDKFLEEVHKAIDTLSGFCQPFMAAIAGPRHQRGQGDRAQKKPLASRKGTQGDGEKAQ